MPETLIPSDVVKAIQESVETKVIKVDGQEYLTRAVHLPPEEPGVESLTVHTLTGLIKFVKDCIHGNQIASIHVENHLKVNVWGHLEGRYLSRPLYATAEVTNAVNARKFNFNQYQSPEEFIIGLQTAFAATEQRALVLGIIGNLKDETVKTVNDDGISQTVAVRQGISLTAEKQIPNPVRLAPFRTFPDIRQPETSFILRVQRGKEGCLPSVGLYETADGQWEIEAIQKIAEYLRDNLELDIPIIA